MPRLPIYEGDFDVYEALPTGVPMARCPDRASQADHRNFTAPNGGNPALPRAIRPMQTKEVAVSVRPHGGKRDFVPAGELTEIPIDLRAC